jgi:hypothetical protein
MPDHLARILMGVINAQVTAAKRGKVQRLAPSSPGPIRSAFCGPVNFNAVMPDPLAQPRKLLVENATCKCSGFQLMERVSGLY